MHGVREALGLQTDPLMLLIDGAFLSRDRPQAAGGIDLYGGPVGIDLEIIGLGDIKVKQ